ncbi:MULTISPECIES: NUDIX hydrolase [Desulfosediminicola]|uniref:NUDIX hydrolase n=1 Tax=Desulfosediminicola TaxID=2886823 RepID=UPI0010AD14F7|nr:CoA pyrophosphatase [Desulfosediminicola ganghwensis]
MSSTPAAAVAIIRVSEPIDSFLLLRRTTNPHDPWSGHFSFPGGRCEPEDRHLLATCIRETHEETGICLSKELVQAELTAAYAGSRTDSRILVQPYLFQLQTRPKLKLDPREIQSYRWLDATMFQNRALHVKAEVLPDHYFPALPLDDYYLWGFTYRLISEVLAAEEIYN